MLIAGLFVEKPLLEFILILFFAPVKANKSCQKKLSCQKIDLGMVLKKTCRISPDQPL